jgi:hypothetical protein
MIINPYESPVPEPEHEVPVGARRQLGPPALALLLLGLATLLIAVGLLLFLLGLMALHLYHFGWTGQAAQQDLFLRSFLAAGILVSCGIAGLILTIGANHMRTFRSRRWAHAAAIVALVPHPLWILFGPFAIWALLALRHPDVKAAFARQRPRTERET